MGLLVEPLDKATALQLLGPMAVHELVGLGVTGGRVSGALTRINRSPARDLAAGGWPGHNDELEASDSGRTAIGSSPRD